MEDIAQITGTDASKMANAEAHDDEKAMLIADADDALQFLRQHEVTGEVVTIDDKKLMRRVDWLLMPLMFSVYYLQYTDKTLRAYPSFSRSFRPLV